MFWFIFSLQQALEHNSFLSPEKKIEQGNVEQAFKHVDQIIEGKWSWARKVKLLKLRTPNELTGLRNTETLRQSFSTLV